ncbi:MAG TPA: PAS-domain containing protein [Beijerinckiaceae bacterium]|nr:PAS-domain containing protein [Beijerinckiaceae bacterium]
MAEGPIGTVGSSGVAARLRRAVRQLWRPLVALPALLLPTIGLADDLGLRLSTGSLPGRLEALKLDLSGPLGMLFVGLAIFSATIAVLHVRARRLWNDQFESQRAVIAELQIRSERAGLFLGSEPQVFVSWDGPGGQPEYEGDPRIVGETITTGRLLDFGNWVAAGQAQALEAAVERLRTAGESFSLKLKSLGGSVIEADGQPVMGRAVMRLRNVTGERQEIARIQEKLAASAGLITSLRALLDTIPQPVWLRRSDGALAFVNSAYAHAVEAKGADDAMARGLELLERKTRDKVAHKHRQGENFRGAAKAVVAGDRRVLDVVDVIGTDGASGGIATDITELESARRDIEQQSEAHVRVLDQLPTAVALFDRQQRLSFYNRAFDRLWQLESGFLGSRPTDMELLDRLRADGKLPEQSDFKEWKLGLQQSFQANETLEDVWHLPSGRALRVVTSPSTKGGVTYLFDDVTEHMHLATSYNRLASMQGETLDSLAEGVAVFGSNGRLQLHNPAFASLWGLSNAHLVDAPHIDLVAGRCATETHAVWSEIRAAVCGLPDERVNRTFDVRTRAGKVLSLGLAPLPDGASLLTVEDVTSTANAARMLSERNQALEAAARFRSEFIHNVSFELRLPLTSVVGIAQLLATGTAGPLNERQRGYANDLMRATDAILALINDILDLASIDQGNLDLKISKVDLRQSIEEASAGLKDRLGGAQVRLELRVAPEVDSILGDERRLRQILFNLLANAVACSDPGDSVVLEAEQGEEGIAIRVLDNGALPATGDAGADSQRRTDRGQSLRLSIVRSLVELHHGRLMVEGRTDGKRQVVCILPAAHDPAQPPRRIAG